MQVTHLENLLEIREHKSLTRKSDFNLEKGVVKLPKIGGQTKTRRMSRVSTTTASPTGAQSAASIDKPNSRKVSIGSVSNETTVSVRRASKDVDPSENANILRKFSKVQNQETISGDKSLTRRNSKDAYAGETYIGIRRLPKEIDCGEKKEPLRRSSRISVPTGTSAGLHDPRGPNSNDAPRRMSLMPLKRNSITKASTVLKARMAFASNLKRKQSVHAQPDPIKDVMEMPTEPRFACTLSPEAQFATMKGYEDVVYDNICKSHPEYKKLIQRSKTPSSKIAIRDMITKDDKEGEDVDNVDFVDSIEEKVNGQALADSPTAEHFKNALTKKLLETQRNSFPSHSPKTSTPTTETMREIKKVPVRVPRERQLVMTYRMQSAMDILDTIRSTEGENPISPRMKSYVRQLTPLKDFTTWSRVWNREFKPVQNIVR